MRERERGGFGRKGKPPKEKKKINRFDWPAGLCLTDRLPR